MGETERYEDQDVGGWRMSRVGMIIRRGMDRILD
jgi:hypothetical protein